MTKVHDPGGKVRYALPDGTRGEAIISPCRRYRTRLARDWTPEGAKPKAIMFFGMNPSTADDSVQDATCGRETERARRWGYTRYLKGNVLDWRATKPQDLPHDLEQACSVANLPEVLRMAAEAELIVMAYGRMHKRYAGLVDQSVEALRATGKPLRCFGRNQDGSAKHPLYLRNDAALVEF